MRRYNRVFAPALALLIAGAGPAVAASATKDPLNSVMWEVVHDTVLAGAPVVFDDDHVQVFTPKSVEDNMDVPVAVEVRGLTGIRAIALLADHNPLPLAAILYPDSANPSFETRIKVQEATPIRAAVQTSDGVWHVGGMRVDAAGGGCTAPPAANKPASTETINAVRGQLWQRPDGTTRLRLRISHPMDTGLVSGKPSFHIENLFVRDNGGKILARLDIHEPVASDPTFTLNLSGRLDTVTIDGRDNDGNIVNAIVTAGSP